MSLTSLTSNKRKSSDLKIIFYTYCVKLEQWSMVTCMSGRLDRRLGVRFPKSHIGFHTTLLKTFTSSKDWIHLVFEHKNLFKMFLLLTLTSLNWLTRLDSCNLLYILHHSPFASGKLTLHQNSKCWEN